MGEAKRHNGGGGRCLGCSAASPGCLAERPGKSIALCSEDPTYSGLGWGAYSVLHGPEIAVGEANAERTDPNYRDVMLEQRLRQALARLNSNLLPETLDDAWRKLTRADAPSLVERNHAAHRMLVDGVTVEYRRPDGSIAGDQARVIDFDEPANNDWVAVNQFNRAVTMFN